MLSKSSKWELGFVHYITKFTISRFVISRFECTYIFHQSTFIDFLFPGLCIYAFTCTFIREKPRSKPQKKEKKNDSKLCFFRGFILIILVSRLLFHLCTFIIPLISRKIQKLEKIVALKKYWLLCLSEFYQSFREFFCFLHNFHSLEKGLIIQGLFC